MVILKNALAIHGTLGSTSLGLFVVAHSQSFRCDGTSSGRRWRHRYVEGFGQHHVKPSGSGLEQFSTKGTQTLEALDPDRGDHRTKDAR